MNTAIDFTGKLIKTMQIGVRIPHLSRPNTLSKSKWQAKCINCGEEKELRYDALIRETIGCRCRRWDKEDPFTGKQIKTVLIGDRIPNSKTNALSYSRWQAKCLKCGLEKTVSYTSLCNELVGCRCQNPLRIADNARMERIRARRLQQGLTVVKSLSND